MNPKENSPVCRWRRLVFLLPAALFFALGTLLGLCRFLPVG